MFIENKYYKYYNNLIHRAKNRLLDCYCEKHHIIPKSIGGSDDKDNLVYLTAKEHFIAHLLLTKITLGKNKSKMLNAIFCMINMNGTKVNSKTYEKLKNEYSLFMQENNPVFLKETKEKISNTLKEYYKSNKIPFEGKKHSEESKKLISEKRKGLKFTEEHKLKISLAHQGKKGFKHSEETKKIISQKNKNINLGRKHSEETKKKLSDIAKMRWSKIKNEKNINPSYTAPN